MAVAAKKYLQNNQVAFFAYVIELITYGNINRQCGKKQNYPRPVDH